MQVVQRWISTCCGRSPSGAVRVSHRRSACRRRFAGRGHLLRPVRLPHHDGVAARRQPARLLPTATGSHRTRGRGGGCGHHRGGFACGPGEWDDLRWHLLSSVTWTENLLVTAVSPAIWRASCRCRPTPTTGRWPWRSSSTSCGRGLWQAGGGRGSSAPPSGGAHRRAGSGDRRSLWLYWAWAADNHAVAYFSPLSRVWQLGRRCWWRSGGPA